MTPTARHGAAMDRAFTLIELLVVVGIIAMLLSILLPAMRKAREAAQSVACLGNLRSIGQAMITYTQDHNAWIPGSPLTSGHALWDDTGAAFALKPDVSDASTPGPCIEIYDFIGPLAQTMQLKLPETDSTVERFQAYRRLRPFLCPAYEDVIATKFRGPPEAENGQAMSYCTAMGFLLPPYEKSRSYLKGRGSMPGSPPYWNNPPGYRPRLDNVGAAAGKIYAADGARWSRYDSAPTFSLAPDPDQNNTNFSDFGAFWGITKSYDRSFPNQMNNADTDARIYAYRHGTREQGQPTGSYRLNAVFFDGHTETLDDLASANPSLWLPRGAVIENPGASLLSGPAVWPDVVERYIAETPYMVP